MWWVRAEYNIRLRRCAASARGAAHNIVVHARFYAPDAHAPGDIVTLPEDEAEHLTRVLRLRAGAQVLVFNGRGQAFDATVRSSTKSAAELLVGTAREAAPEAHVAITLVQAVLKGDKMDDVVRDAVMIGVTAIQPVLTMRTEVSRTSLDRSRRHDRWQRIAVSSAKQCGRAVVPQVLASEPFEDVVSALGPAGRTAIMFVEPGASSQARPLTAVDSGAAPKALTVLVGPEGGWTPEEIAAAERVAQLVTLGGRTLRADAMALIGVTALFVRYGEYAR